MEGERRGKKWKGRNKCSKDKTGGPSLEKENGGWCTLSRGSKSTREERGKETTSPIARFSRTVDYDESPSLSRVVRDSQSVRSRYETRQKKSRGLTVSFVSDENLQPKESHQQQSDSGLHVHHYGLRKRKCGDVSFTEEREKGESLTASLNSSRFGALEHQRMQNIHTDTYMYMNNTHDMHIHMYIWTSVYSLDSLLRNTSMFGLPPKNSDSSLVPGFPFVHAQFLRMTFSAFGISREVKGRVWE